MVNNTYLVFSVKKEGKMGKRLWKYNEDYFKEIDTFEKAYWLGFIMADGYLCDNRLKPNKSLAVSLRIRLSEEDKEHLEKLNESLSYNKPIKIVKNYGVYKNCRDLAEFNLSSRKMVDHLYNHGLTSGDKSCKEVLPTCINTDELKKGFILGLFDGDGHITLTDKTTEWGIVSSKEMLIEIKKFLEENLDIKLSEVGLNGSGENLYRLRTFSKKKY